MKKSYLKQWIIAVFLLAIVLAAPLFAADFEITKVIEVGPADEGFMSWPLRWSPDGKWLAFFRDGWLMLVDTLGTSRQVKKMGLFPRRFDWLSDEEMVGYFDQGTMPDSSVQRISVIDVSNGAETVLEEHVRYKHKVSRKSLQGPWRTLEGDVYYVISERVSAALQKTSEVRKKVVTRKRAQPDNLTENSNSILHWGADGIYKVTLSASDSVRISPHPEGTGPGGITLSPDGSIISVGGSLLSLRDSITINLNIAVADIPDMAKYCGCMSVSFNPIFREVQFVQSCDSDGHETLIERSGVFDLDGNSYRFLEVADNAKFIPGPVYAPDGLKIALISNGICYMIFREQIGGKKWSSEL